MPSASSRNRRLTPLPHSTVFTSSSLRMITRFSLRRPLSGGLDGLGSCAELDEQPVKILYDVAARVAGGCHPGDTRAAHDRRVGADLAELLDVLAGLDAEADGDRDVALSAQDLHDGDER